MFLVLLVVFKEKFGEKMPSGANWLRHIYASDEITSLSNIHMLKADFEVASRPRMSINVSQEFRTDELPNLQECQASSESTALEVVSSRSIC